MVDVVILRMRLTIQRLFLTADMEVINLKMVLALFIFIVMNNHSYASDLHCPEGTSVPEELVGFWSRTLVKYNSEGRQALEITSNCRLLFYEFGDGKFLAEWSSGLSQDTTYIFKESVGQPIVDITDSELHFTEFKDVVTIIDARSNGTIREWQMSGSAGTFKYKLTNDGESDLMVIERLYGREEEIKYYKSDKQRFYSW